MIHHKNMQESLSGIVRENRKIARNHFRMALLTDKGFRDASPGQFLMIRPVRQEAPLLGRPMSIYRVASTGEGTVVEFLYQVVGEGTEALSRLRKGDGVRLMGPLGRGFDLFPDRSKIVLVAGGMGIAPLTFLAESYRKLKPGVRQKIACYAGAKSESCFIGIERMKKSAHVKISSDDGTCGHHGFVTELIEEDLPSYGVDETVVYACGPAAMLKMLKEMTDGTGLKCQASVEERMACGIGACLGCAIRMKNGSFRRVCVDGPVFALNELEFD